MSAAPTAQTAEVSEQKPAKAPKPPKEPKEGGKGGASKQPGKGPGKGGPAQSASSPEEIRAVKLQKVRWIPSYGTIKAFCLEASQFMHWC